jgi:hypothetical protein
MGERNGNGGTLRVVLGVLSLLGAVTFAALGYALSAQAKAAGAGERIRANEVRIDNVERRLDRFDAKLDAIGAAVNAKMPAKE